MLIAPVAARLGVPLLVHFHGYDVSWLPADPLYLRCLRKLFRQMRLALAVSDHMRQRLLSLGSPPFKTLRHYTGVPHEYFREYRDRPTVDDAAALLQVGRLVPVKGHLRTLEALARVRESVPEVRLRLVGEGPLRQSLECEVNRLGLTRHVDFLGLLSEADTRSEIGRALALIAPSESVEGQEGLPNVVVEALAAGVPVVASYHGGIPEAVRYGIQDWLIPEGDVAALASRILRVLREPSLRAQLSRVGSDIAVREFYLPEQCRLLRTIYDDLLSQ
jgi:glycosyltransferase involved in cell wall biosynthesis